MSKFAYVVGESWKKNLCYWLALTVVSLTGCQNANSNLDQNEPLVVSTSTIIADLTETIGGEEIQHQSILEAGEDPHVYEPVPADNIALEQADLILYNGYNLEPGLIRLIEASGIDAKKLAVGEVVTPLDYDYQGTIEPDPHVWGDVSNVIEMVKAIRDELIALSPENEAEFNTNAANLIEELELLDAWIETQIATIPASQRKLVTTHDAFQYYAGAYGIDVIGTLIGISTEEQPSAKTVKNLSEVVKNSGVPTIFTETTINPSLIRAVATEAGVNISPQPLYADSIGTTGDADSYIKMQVVNTRAIVKALGGSDQEFRTPPSETRTN